MSITKKLLYIDNDGIQASTAPGTITNIGGTSNPSFTVAGRGLLFDDGTSTNGGVPAGGNSTLQTVYNNSHDAQGNAAITLQTGKDFVIYDDTNNNIYFKIQSTTGAVTITGDLNVLGNATIKSTTEIADHWTIQTTTPSTVALSIEPTAGNTPLADLINVKKANGGPAVFRVDASGKTTLSTLQVNGNQIITGTINGKDIVTMDNELYDHLFATTFPKHQANQIQVIPTIPTLPGINNVQDALQGLATQIANVSLGATVALGYEFVQALPSNDWVIHHNHNTKKVQFTIYDDNGNWILPNSFMFIDNNTVEVKFGVAQAGRAILMMF